MNQKIQVEKNKIEVSFVIPCLDEEETLKIAIQFARKAIEKLAVDCEIVVADNGSTDKSVEIAEALSARVIHVPSRGYGNALIHGIQEAEGEYIVIGDADGTYDFFESVAFIKKLQEEKVDIVMGSRLNGNIEKGAMPFLHRYLGTPVLSFLIRLFFGLKISDCNCGMRAFTKSAFEKMNLISGGMEFASEMLIKAGILGMKIEEIPCSLFKDKRTKTPHLKTWSDGWKHLKFIILFVPQYLILLPGWLLFVFGLVMTIILSTGKLEIGTVSFDTHFMWVSSIPLIVGYQLIWLYKFGYYFISFSGFIHRRKQENISLEKSIIFSGILFTLGIVLSGFVGIEWWHKGFGTQADIRLLMLSIDMLIISFLTVINSFMVSMMNIKILHSNNKSS
jgi:glycosyltransferase involved in cell wall biosynthesis